MSQPADEHDVDDYVPDTTPVTVEQFRAEAEEMLAKNGGNPESLGILLRHSIHPFGYERAFDYMRTCADLTGESLTADGVWERGAQGELWLAKARAVRASQQSSSAQDSAS
ncbi:hypothetical protein [Myxococcus virescens]|uniref:Uncharacterized protein n=1 Tax=Myxococcus virescens TaxID=83456 RepID=A0ABY0MJE3_9BACT|nr:hypothetical protein [Myxococcus virescens]SDD65512.1 hypothetical protein SAMN04488504_102144 [Myxococcus virescens]